MGFGEIHSAYGAVQIHQQGFVWSTASRTCCKYNLVTAIQSPLEVSLQIRHDRFDALLLKPCRLTWLAHHGTQGETCLVRLAAKHPADLTVGTDD
jgi:hypothetical protein